MSKKGGLLSALIERTIDDMNYEIAGYELQERSASSAKEDKPDEYIKFKKMSLAFLRKAYNQAIIVKRQFPSYKKDIPLDDREIVGEAIEKAESIIKQHDDAIDSLVNELEGARNSLEEGKKYANQLKDVCNECKSAYRITLRSLPFVASGVLAAISFDCAMNGEYGCTLLMGSAAVLNFAAGLAGQRKKNKI